MKFVNEKTSVPKQKLLSLLENSDLVNQGVKFDEKRGKPRMLVKTKGNRISITCRYVGGVSKDNGFLVGTVFIGSIKESADYTRIRGVITTSPIYHLLLVALTAYFIYRCIALGAINPIPIILVIFSFIMFRDEFKKQGVISRFISRAIRRGESE